MAQIYIAHDSGQVVVLPVIVSGVFVTIACWRKCRVMDDTNLVNFAIIDPLDHSLGKVTNDLVAAITVRGDSNFSHVASKSIVKYHLTLLGAAN